MTLYYVVALDNVAPFYFQHRNAELKLKALKIVFNIKPVSYIN